MDEEGWVMYHGCGPVLRVVGACGGLGQGLGRGSRGSRLFSDHCAASKFLLIPPYFGHATLYDGEDGGWMKPDG